MRKRVALARFDASDLGCTAPFMVRPINARAPAYGLENHARHRSIAAGEETVQMLYAVVRAMVRIHFS